jgi:hypothetical protein
VTKRLGFLTRTLNLLLAERLFGRFPRRELRFIMDACIFALVRGQGKGSGNRKTTQQSLADSPLPR